MPTTQSARPPKSSPTYAKAGQGFYFDLLPTPNPKELCFQVKYPAATFKPTTVPEIGTTYGNSSFLPVRGSISIQGFENYRLLNIRREGADLWFKYGLNKTDEQKNNSPFRTFFTSRRYTWPAVLEDLYVVETFEFEQAVYNGTTTQTQPSYFPRYTFRPAVSVSTVVMIEQFVAPTEWSKASITHRQPIPTGVHASWVGLEFDFQECLHPDIVITEKVPGARIVPNVGVVASPLARNPQRKFVPQTNFLDWAPFIYDDSVEPSDGFWVRERVTYFPPIRPPDVYV